MAGVYAASPPMSTNGRSLMRASISQKKRILDRTDESFPVAAAPRGSGCDEFPPDPFLVELALQFLPDRISEQALDESICQFESIRYRLYHSGSGSAGDKSPKTL
ncbi:hypothetical protein T06_6246 [Trichinella sp. T6]|nr:hypothetical protein T06_6246 [Trichinella sp. T6]